jgi:snurportin-1
MIIFNFSSTISNLLLLSFIRQLKRSLFNMQSDFKELYKSHSIDQAERQAHRREKLLQEQKLKRSNALDQARTGFIDALQNVSTGYRSSHNKLYRNILQFSEWLHSRPDHLTKWQIVPCPIGKRCIVVGNDRYTNVYNKRGKQMMQPFKSNLPGGGQYYSKDYKMTTILDCIYVEQLHYFYVLDLIHYGEHNFVDCEAEFRIFFIKNKIKEEKFVLNKSQVGCPVSIDGDLLQQYVSSEPELMFPDVTGLQLDGFLFYHKESSYVHGKTPLVGWLNAFMLPEVFPDLVSQVHDCYLQKRPDNYKDYLSYIRHYDEQAAAKKKPRKFYRKKKISESDAMEQEPVDDEFCSELEAMKRLETEGMDN